MLTTLRKRDFAVFFWLFPVAYHSNAVFFSYSLWRTTPVHFFWLFPVAYHSRAVFFSYSLWRTTPVHFFWLFPVAYHSSAVFFGYSPWRTTPMQFFSVIPCGVPPMHSNAIQYYFKRKKFKVNYVIFPSGYEAHAFCLGN